MECIAEFGPHTDHTDCGMMLAEMTGESNWYASYNYQSGQWNTIH